MSSGTSTEVETDGAARTRRPPSTGHSPARMVEAYERDRLGHLRAAFEEHGPVVELSPGTVLVAEPNAAHEVLRRTNTDFLTAANLMLEDMETQKGDPVLEEWMDGRRRMQAAMATDLFTEHRQWLAEQTGELADRWARQGEVRAAVDDLERMMGRSFVRFWFGTRSVPRVSDAVSTLLKALLPIVASPFRFPAPVRAVMPRFVRAHRARRRLVDEIREAMAAPGSGGLADRLAEAETPPELLVRMLVSNGIASYGVPAAALTWSMTELARHPEAAEETAESVRAFGRDDDSPDEVRRVLDESLRLWPPTWLLFRNACGEQVCGEWQLPADCAVMVSPYVIHRTAECYGDDPDAFRPARWRDLTPDRGAFLPFGAGPRMCVGARLARAELETVLGRLTADLDLGLIGGTPPTPDVQRVMTPVGPGFTARRR
ncbi:cytochrome P450 [Streptomyces sp. NPDC048172]|uniref:cytochrome P450 n=1 Tax=Streptomyces sp. NPDC048172 TaxID=3365505 RepID=UPI003714A488